MTDPTTPATTSAQDTSQQARTVKQLQQSGWVTIQPSQPVDDGSVLMQLTTPEGVSHIIVMPDGERVDARQKLGKSPPAATQGAP